MNTVTVVCLWLLLFAAVINSKSNKDYVRELVASTFDSQVLAGEDYLVEFYSPHCGHCKKFAPDYAKIAVHLNGVLKVGRISVSDSATLPLMKKYKVDSVPTVFIFKANGEHILYEGESRAPSTIVKWVLKKLSEPVISIIGINELSEFLFVKENEQKSDEELVKFSPRRFLLIHNGSIPDAYKNEAIESIGKYIFGSLSYTSFPSFTDLTDELKKLSVFSGLKYVNWSSGNPVFVKLQGGDSGDSYVSYKVKQKKTAQELLDSIDSDEDDDNKDGNKNDNSNDKKKNDRKTGEEEEETEGLKKGGRTDTTTANNTAIVVVFAVVVVVIFLFVIMRKKTKRVELVELKNIDWGLEDGKND